MKIDEIWIDLENDQSLSSGILVKRLSSMVLSDIYVAVRAPEMMRCLAIHISVENQPDTSSWNRLRDIKVEILTDSQDRKKCYLLFLLLNKQHNDIFSVLSEDLINHVAQITDEKNLIAESLNRLAKWQTLFDKLGPQGLSPEAQRGLYGEVFFLQKFLNVSDDKEHCVSSWQVPSNTVQDFHHSDWAVEVKTTHGNNHQKIQISSERQLDDTIVPKIFLYHLSLDVRVDHGETLNQLVEVVECNLEKNITALSSFRLKLFEVGYFDIHKSLYQHTGYNIRQETVFKIAGDFPRITENEIRGGVGDVKYSISIADCTSFMKTDLELFDSINKN
ncbi:MAG: PD-(D/E)XK motif protein [Pyrinomonadaceae bacterium]|nr:PD-(D/E)XK motif protein [Chloracidobacterium sp.]